MYSMFYEILLKPQVLLLEIICKYNNLESNCLILEYLKF